MNCKNCGSFIENPTIPCPYCGEINQDNNLIESESNYNQEQYPVKKGLTKKQWSLIMGVILLLIASIGILFLVLKPDFFIFNNNSSSNTTIIEDNEDIKEQDKINDKEKDDSDEDDDDEDEDEDNYSEEINEYYIDIDKDTIYNYYVENSVKIISIIPISKSKYILTEKEAIKFFKGRGFNNVEVHADYDINGNLDEKTIENPTDTKHPYYNAYYISETTGFWNISLMNNQITAYPAEYVINRVNNEQYDGKIIELSESDSVTGYDSFGNNYYVVIPKETVLTIKVVNTINKKTLDNYKFD